MKRIIFLALLAMFVLQLKCNDLTANNTLHSECCQTEKPTMAD